MSFLKQSLQLYYISSKNFLRRNINCLSQTIKSIFKQILLVLLQLHKVFIESFLLKILEDNLSCSIIVFIIVVLRNILTNCFNRLNCSINYKTIL